MNCLIETILIRIKSIETMLGAGIASIKQVWQRTQLTTEVAEAEVYQIFFIFNFSSPGI